MNRYYLSYSFLYYYCDFSFLLLFSFFSLSFFLFSPCRAGANYTLHKSHHFSASQKIVSSDETVFCVVYTKYVRNVAHCVLYIHCVLNGGFLLCLYWSICFESVLNKNNFHCLLYSLERTPKATPVLFWRVKRRARGEEKWRR